ncbi:hypothetical protein V6V47_01375 [Micromonospora sp. CPCC 205539]|uniref:hypothetical protein n=1 Tax=Micromonospora sp. CPCC 205539 TaxID=3122408 RepID=UPI002FEEF52B
MKRKRNSTARQALALAFAAGAMFGAAGTLTLRRRQSEVDLPGEVAGHLDAAPVPPLGGRLGGSSPAPVREPAAQHN